MDMEDLTETTTGHGEYWHFLFDRNRASKTENTGWKTWIRDKGHSIYYMSKMSRTYFADIYDMIFKQVLNYYI